MKLIRKQLSTLLVLAIASFSVVVLPTAASALPGEASLAMVKDGPGNILGSDFLSFSPGQALPAFSSFSVCSSGEEDVQSLQFEENHVNFTLNDIEINATNTTSTSGSIDEEALEWTGLLETGQCVHFDIDGVIGGEVGETVTIRFDLVSSELTTDGGTLNVETDTTDNYVSVTRDIDTPADLSIDTHLLTTAEIVSGTDIQYALDVTSEGPGDFHGTSLGIYFLIPTSTTFVSVTDLDPDDNIDEIGCFDVGPVALMDPAFAAYDQNAVICQYLLEDQLMTVGQQLRLIFDLEATDSFDSGVTEIRGLLFGPGEPDSIDAEKLLNAGTDPFTLNLNNSFNLTFDADPLTVTVQRCSGQSAITTSGNGCFRVSFNKTILADSFTEEDIVLTGGGSVSSFEQIDASTWEVNVTGITPGATLVLTLAEAGVQDYSAVTNGVQVLGENTIRYEVDDPNTDSADDNADGSTAAVTSATGSLAATGTNVGFAAPLTLICLGIVLALAKRTKKSLV